MIAANVLIASAQRTLCRVTPWRAELALLVIGVGRSMRERLRKHARVKGGSASL
jgi:hypothetical protein